MEKRMVLTPSTSKPGTFIGSSVMFSPNIGILTTARRLPSFNFKYDSFLMEWSCIDKGYNIIINELPNGTMLMEW